LSCISLSPLLKCTTHRLTVLTSTVSSLYTFSKQWEIQQHVSVSYALLCQTPFWLTALLLLSHDNQTYSTLVGRFNLYNTTINIRIRSYGLTQKNRRHYIRNAPHIQRKELYSILTLVVTLICSAISPLHSFLIFIFTKEIIQLFNAGKLQCIQ
jgi:hypothetical protein